jgi:hypothetical protein
MAASALTASAQASYSLQSSVMGAAGAGGFSTNFRAKSTMAQPTPIGTGSASDKVLSAGFWAKPWVVSGLLEDPLPGPLVTKLHRSYPNPFTSMTRIDYSLASEREVKIRVFSIEGKVVRTLVSGREAPGHHYLLWDGQNDIGMSVGPGVYFCRFEAGSYTSVKKLVVLK